MKTLSLRIFAGHTRTNHKPSKSSLTNQATCRPIIPILIVFILTISPLISLIPIQQHVIVEAEEIQPQENRTVLMELFTETWCPPCKNADLATDDLREDFRNDELVILEYHYDQNGDPFYTSETNFRFNGYYDFDSWPSAIFDGTIEEPGSGSVDEVHGRYMTHVETRIAVKSHYYIKVVESNYADGSGYFRAYINEKTDSNRTDVSIRSVIFRDTLHFDGGNDIKDHRYVVREMFEVSMENSTKVIEYNFTLPDDSQYLENGDDIGIAIFVQDDATGEVLQSHVQLHYAEGTGSREKNHDSDEETLFTGQTIYLISAFVIIFTVAGLGVVFMKKDRSIKNNSRGPHTTSSLRSSKPLSTPHSLSRGSEAEMFTTCPHCKVRVKKVNIGAHIKKVHPGK